MCTFGKCNRDVSISTYANKQTATFCAKLLLSAADGDKHVGYLKFHIQIYFQGYSLQG